MSENRKIYAVDFDGTLAETDFPVILRPKRDMIRKCKEIKEKGDTLILWTCRCGKDLEDAVAFCKAHGLEFDYVNENTRENIEKYGEDCRKIFAHEYIDDKAWSLEREKEIMLFFLRLFLVLSGVLAVGILELFTSCRRKEKRTYGKTGIM